MRRISRPLRWWVVVLMLAGILLAAISTRTPGVVLSARSPASSGRTIVYTDMAGNPIFSPFGNCCLSSASWSSLFAQLVDIGTGGQPVPDLLAGIPSVENHQILDGGKSVILTLKRHQYWSSGQEITAADIRFGWQVSMEPGTGTYSATQCTGTCDRITSISVRSRYEAVLHLQQPYGPLLTCCLPPVWPHQWEAMGMSPRIAATYLANSNVNPLDPAYWTGGPFRVMSSRLAGDTVFTRMAHYQVHPTTNVSRIIDRVVGNAVDRIAEFARRQVDVVIGSVGFGMGPGNSYAPQSVLSDLQKHPGTYRIVLTPSFSPVILEFNVLDRTYAPDPYNQYPLPPSGKKLSPVPNVAHDLRIRQALALAIDRRRLLRATFHITSRDARDLTAYSPLVATPHVTEMFADRSIRGAWDPLAGSFVPYGPRALRDARSLLQQAGYANGFQIEVTALAGVTPPAVFNALAAGWGRIGVRARLIWLAGPRIQDYCYYWKQLAGQFEAIIMMQQSGPDPNALAGVFDPHRIYHVNHQPPGRLDCEHPPTNLSGITDRVISQGMHQGRVTVDTRQRGRWYGQVQQELIRKAYWAPLYYIPYVMGVGPRVRGVTEAPDGSVYTYSWRTVP